MPGTGLVLGDMKLNKVSIVSPGKDIIANKNCGHVNTVNVEGDTELSKI